MLLPISNWIPGLNLLLWDYESIGVELLSGLYFNQSLLLTSINVYGEIDLAMAEDFCSYLCFADPVVVYKFRNKIPALYK